MEHYDSQMAARVWQRVQNSSDPAALPNEILLLIKEEIEDISTYLYAAKTQGKEQAALSAMLIKNSRSCVHILKGIYYLISGVFPEVPTVHTAPSASLLRRCYARCLQRSVRYSQQRSHSEYAYAFAQLEASAQQRCVWLLQLIGSGKEGNK